MYEYDEAVPKDQAEAVKWFRKAADQGHKYAKEQLIKYLLILHLLFCFSY